MVRESLDGSLRHLTEVGALAVAVGALALLLAALGAELLRRAQRAPRLLARLDRLVPHPARTVAAGALALATALPVAAAAHADDSVRGWLTGSSRAPSTTTTTAPVATHGSVDARTPAPVPDPGVVGRPDGPPAPAPVAAPGPGPVAVAAPAPAPPASPTAPSSRGSAPGEQHVVAPGECLWAIAQARLGAGATNQAIDAGWRAIYAANRAAIGADPGLIHPGLVLSLPPLVPAP